MLDFLLAGANVPFGAAFMLIFIIAFFEGAGLVMGIAFSSLLDSLVPDYSIGPDTQVGSVGADNALSRFLGWLRVGEVPVLILLMMYLFAFGSAGYVLNFFAVKVFAYLLPTVVTVPLAVLTALPATRVGGAWLAKVMPKDETSAVSLDSLVGRCAVITAGESTSMRAAEARVRDQFGCTHYIMVRAEEGHGPLESGLPLLLVRRRGNEFIAIEAERSVSDK